MVRNYPDDTMKTVFRAALLPCLLLLAGLLPSCAPVDLLNSTIRTEGLVIAKDIPYAPGPSHTLDIYRPDAFAGALPIAVFFYGGAWQTGSKNDYLFVAAELARRGILVVVPDYRKYPPDGYPAFLDDGAAAVAYVRRVAPSWGGDPNRIFLVGHSAGAYIAAMLALDPAYLSAAGDSRDRLAGIVGIAGPYDFLPITGPDVQAVFGAYRSSPATQPINWVDGRNPPMLLLAGSADTTVEPRNTTALADRIRAAGGPVTEKIYPDTGHIGIITGFAPWFRDRSPVLDDTASFITSAQPVAAAVPGR
jgi:acetyl esterase/lipase